MTKGRRLSLSLRKSKKDPSQVTQESDQGKKNQDPILAAKTRIMRDIATNYGPNSNERDNSHVLHPVVVDLFENFFDLIKLYSSEFNIADLDEDIAKFQILAQKEHEQEKDQKSEKELRELIKKNKESGEKPHRIGSKEHQTYNKEKFDLEQQLKLHLEHKLKAQIYEKLVEFLCYLKDKEKEPQSENNINIEITDFSFEDNDVRLDLHEVIRTCFTSEVTRLKEIIKEKERLVKQNSNSFISKSSKLNEKGLHRAINIFRELAIKHLEDQEKLGSKKELEQDLDEKRKQSNNQNEVLAAKKKLKSHLEHGIKAKIYERLVKLLCYLIDQKEGVYVKENLNNATKFEFTNGSNDLDVINSCFSEVALKEVKNLLKAIQKERAELFAQHFESVNLYSSNLNEKGVQRAVEIFQELAKDRHQAAEKLGSESKLREDVKEKREEKKKEGEPNKFRETTKKLQLFLEQKFKAQIYLQFKQCLETALEDKKKITIRIENIIDKDVNLDVEELVKFCFEEVILPGLKKMPEYQNQKESTANEETVPLEEPSTSPSELKQIEGLHKDKSIEI